MKAEATLQREKTIDSQEGYCDFASSELCTDIGISFTYKKISFIQWNKKFT